MITCCRKRATRRTSSQVREATSRTCSRGAWLLSTTSSPKGPDPHSRKLGNVQGVYLLSVSFQELPHIYQQFTSVFTDKWKGSTIAYQGDDGNLLPVREIAVVGGTGEVRSASGYCFIRTVKQTDDFSYILEFETHLFVPTVNYTGDE